MTAVRAQGARPIESVSRQSDNEAFATYVDWASEEIRQRGWLKFSFGPAIIPMGLQELPATPVGFAIPEAAPLEPWIANRLTAAGGVPGVGLEMSLPAGFSYQLNYGSGKAGPASGLFKGLKRSLSADINRVDVTHSYEGILSWQTPVDGFTLRGGISQMHLHADAVTQDAPLWSRAGVDGNSRGNLFNTSLTWRASAEQSIGNLRLSAEYMQSEVNVTFNDSVLTSQVGEGYTGRAAYQVTDWLQFGSSYSLYYADRNDRTGEALAAMGKDPAGAWIRDIGVSARLDFNSRVALQLEGHLMNGLLGVVEGTDEDWRRFGARMTIKF